MKSSTSNGKHRRRTCWRAGYTINPAFAIADSSAHFRTSIALLLHPDKAHQPSHLAVPFIDFPFPIDQDSVENNVINRPHPPQTMATPQPQIHSYVEIHAIRKQKAQP